MARIIGIISGKGGVGKTTLVSNLGAVLAHKFNKKVTVIDCNLTTSHLSLYLGMYYNPITINQVLKREASVEEAMYQHSSGMHVIPASLTLRDLEGIDILNLKDAIKPISDENDIILLDGSPGLGRETLGTIKASKEILFIATPYVASLMDIIRSQEVVRELEGNLSGIVLNMVRKEKNEIRKSEIEGFTGLDVISIIPYDRDVYRSVSSGMPVIFYNPRSKAAKELVKLASFIAGEEFKEHRFSRILSILRPKFKI